MTATNVTAAAAAAGPNGRPAAPHGGRTAPGAKPAASQGGPTAADGTPAAARWWPAALLLVTAAVVLAPVAAMVPLRLTVAGCGAVVLMAISYHHPPFAAYLLLVATPLTAGIQRDALFPVLRPHEAIGLVVGAGVALRALAQLRTRHGLPLSLERVDVAILAMAASSSILPLLWMAARGMTPTLEDLLYAAAIWKYYGLFLLIRASVRTEHQVIRCLRLSVGAGALVAVVAILQAVQLAGVPDLVNTVYPIEGGIDPVAGRGSATLASSIAVGDVMAYNLAICLGWLARIRRQRWLMLAMAVLLALGALASGQFSGVIALGLGVVAVAIVTGQLKRLTLALIPTALVGAIVLRPVLEARLARIDIGTGLPQSWWVRLENLRLFVWPEVFSGYNWLFGVRPTAIIEVAAPWGNLIYIESGHTWLLWTGGIPFFLAYLYFVWVAVRTTAAVAVLRPGGTGVAAIASFASLLAMFVLMSFDPHLTMRGTADLLFSLLGLATADTIATATAARPAMPRPRRAEPETPTEPETPRTPAPNSTGSTPDPDASPAAAAAPGPAPSP